MSWKIDDFKTLEIQILPPILSEIAVKLCSQIP